MQQLLKNTVIDWFQFVGWVALSVIFIGIVIAVSLMLVMLLLLAYAFGLIV